MQPLKLTLLLSFRPSSALTLYAYPIKFINCLYCSDNMYSCINREMTTDPMICISDRGLMFGDGFFETLRVIQSKPYLWHHHVQRLTDGLSLAQIKVDISAIMSDIVRLVELNELPDALVKVIVTRGVGGLGYRPNYASKPTVIITAFPYVRDQLGPVQICLATSARCADGYPLSQYKTLQKLGSVISKMEALQKGCFEGLMLNNRDEICEVSSGNIFWYQEDKIFTPAIECGIVRGVMRERIIEIYGAITGRFSISDLLEASAIFISNASWITIPVQRVHPYGKIFSSLDISTKINQRILSEQYPSRDTLLSSESMQCLQSSL